MQVDDLHLYLKCQSSTGVFQTFASKNQLAGLTLSGTLTGNLFQNPILRIFQQQHHFKEYKVEQK